MVHFCEMHASPNPTQSSATWGVGISSTPRLQRRPSGAQWEIEWQIYMLCNNPTSAISTYFFGVRWWFELKPSALVTLLEPPNDA